MGNSHSDDSKPAKGNNDSVLKPFVKHVAKSGELEIIIKCSVEEMTKVFFKDYVIVWHDPNVNNKENQEYITQLEKFCEVFTLTEWEKTSIFIKEAKTVCHVITSGTNGELLVKEIFESENVCNIYVFCRNKEYHESWAKGYSKISCVETHIQRLFNQIQQNLLEWYKKASSLNYNLPAFAPIFDDSDKSDMNSLHLYLKIIPNFKNREQAKEDFVNLSKAIYSDVQNTKFIADFETYYNEYNKDLTLKWYTLESFLYKVTNNCLRIATSDSIQYCRLALKDIEQAIKDQYQAKSKNFNGLLYRGAYLSEQEWSSLKENQDKEIEMHGFLSVSKVKNVALNFMNTDLSKKALITIIVPKGPNEEEQGFAEMEEYSQYPQEKEILFNVRSRFTVLETEDDYAYSENSKCRHLVLLYGAQGFRKFISEENPVQEQLVANAEDLSCTQCHVKSEGILFFSIADHHYYCKSCTDSGVGPFLCVDKMEKSQTVKIKGCPLMNSSPGQTPFYGYKCCSCQAKKQKSYFVCTDCIGKKWCECCFEKEALGCLKTGHNILLETSPFSFWCERMSANEFNHLKFQNNIVQRDCNVFPQFQQAHMYFESHEYDKAIEFYTHYIQENETKSQDSNLATSYNMLGKIYEKQGDYKRALEYFLKSLGILKSVHGDNHPLTAVCENNIGLIYDNQGECKKALESYFKALDINKEISGENNSTSATYYNNIGLAYEKQGDDKNALENYLKSLDIRKSIHGESHPDVANSYNSLGSIYNSLGQYKSACENHLKCLKILKELYGENHPFVAISYHNLGNAEKSQGEWTKALEYYFKSVEIKKALHGDSHPLIAITLQSIGHVYKKQKEYKKALEYYLKALDMYKSVSEGDSHPDIAVLYNNIGMVLQDQKEYEKALEYYMKSLGLKKSLYGDNSSEVATTLQNTGGVYDEQEEYEMALEYYLEVISRKRSVYGEDHPEVASCFNTIGMVYYNLKAGQKALVCYLKALEIFKAVHGDNHPLVGACLHKIGLVYDDQEEYKTALWYYLKSLDIFKLTYKDNPCELATSCQSLGMAYYNLGAHELALGFLLKSLEIKKSVSGENHLDLGACYNNIGMTYYNQKEYEKAREIHLKALEIFKSAHGENHSNVASSLDNIGMTYYYEGEYEEALEYLLKSLDIFKSVYGEIHPVITACYNKIGPAYYNQGDYDKALEYHLKCLQVEKALYGDKHPSVAMTYANIGMAFCQKEEYETALGFLLQAMNIYKVVYGESHPQTMGVHLEILKIIEIVKPEQE